MDIIPFVLPLLYLLFVLGLCTFLLVRGVTHSFIALFASGALLHMIPQLGYVILRQMPGGFSAYDRFLPVLSIFGAFGTLCFAAGFLLLARFLLATRG